MRGTIRLVSVVLLSLAFLIGLGGCATAVQPGAATQPASLDQWNAKIVQNESNIRLGSDLATSAILYSQKDLAKRQEFATNAYAIAKAVNDAVATRDLDLTSASLLVMDKINQSKSDQKDLAGFLLSSVTTIADQSLKDYFADAGPDTRKAAVQAMLRGASKGVMESAARMYPGLRPATQPAALSEVDNVDVFRHRLRRLT